MSGGQDPSQMDWEIISFDQELDVYDLLQQYLSALDKNNMVLVYALRSLLRKKLATRLEKASVIQ